MAKFLENLGFFLVLHLIQGIWTLQNNPPSFCPREELQRCFQMAEPLLRNPALVFPDTVEDITMVCRSWSNLVNCVQRYASSCLPAERRREMQSVLSEASSTVNDMCTSSRFQSEYLQYAPCIKVMAVDESKCRRQLNYLVDQVSSFSMSNAHMCCAHHAFRECMLSATRYHCDTLDDSLVLNFARQLFSRALGFLLRQCEDFVPSSDCPRVHGFTSTGPVWPTRVPTQSRDPATVAFTTAMTRVTFPTNSWRRTTTRPWLPAGFDNSLTSRPNQQGLSSSATQLRNNVMFPLFILTIILSLHIFY